MEGNLIMSGAPVTLGDALPAEIARVRDEILPVYDSIGPAGVFAATMMRQTLDQASKAMITGDLPGMIAAYERMKGFNL